MTGSSLRRSLASAAVALALLSGCGGDEERSDSGPLRWEGEPLVYDHQTLEGDRVATGKLRNGSGEPVRLDAGKEVKVVDEDGDEFVTNAIFTQTFGHGLFNPTRLPEARLPEGELRRIGKVAFVEPGKSIPVTLSWHDEDDRGVGVELPGGYLRLPD